MEYSIALAGNPNVGKTSLYNRITHSLEHVGNWHGVTVSKISKSVLFDHKQVLVTDLPGFYSMTVYSFEEAVSRDAVLSGDHNLIVSVAEVNNLARNLYLTMQLLELDVPVILVVNMMDELKKQGKVLNYRKLEHALKIPIVPMSAKYHSDVHLLLEVALDYIDRYDGNSVELTYLDRLPLKDVEAVIGENAVRAGFKKRYAAIKVLEKDSFVLEKLALSEAQTKALEALGDWQARVAQYRYEFIDSVTEGAISRNVSDLHREMHEHEKHAVPIESQTGQASSANDVRKSVSEERHLKRHDKYAEKALYMHGYSRIDRIVLNKYLALPIFLLVMAAVFVITFGLVGNWLSALLDLGIEKLVYQPLTSWLNGINTPGWAVDLLGDGIIHGVGGILTFLPQVVLLFFFLALLEDSGYISRVAFMTDGLFRKIGLSGRSAFTMLMGFGCSATAVLTARGLEDDMMRKKTVLLTPFMSCSARLPVYSVIAAAFFTGGAAAAKPFIIFAMYILGAAIALIAAAVFEKGVKKMKSGKLSFIMEMPPYRRPTAERVFQLIMHNAKVFLIRVGTTIFTLNVIVWLLSNFSVRGYVPEVGGYSFLQSVSMFVAPVFKPLGFGEWRAVTALVSGLVAKEVVVSVIESFGGPAVVFVGQYAALSAVTFMIFTLLYIPCIATLTAIGKEIGRRWAVFSFVFQLIVAYAVALVFRGIGLLFCIRPGWTAGILIGVLTAAVCALTAVSYLRRRKSGCGGCCGGCNGCDRSRK